MSHAPHHLGPPAPSSTAAAALDVAPEEALRVPPSDSRPSAVRHELAVASHPEEHVALQHPQHLTDLIRLR